jgi:DedD protein
MEEQVKARLIGATVLVVIAVALVPELLSGPRRHADGAAETEGKRGTRTYTIDLSGGSGEGKVAPLPRTSADSRATTTRLPTVAPPGPAAIAEQQPPSAAAEPAATVADVAQAPGTGPEVTPPPATVPPPAAQAVAAAPAPGDWAVQVGAFGSVATARKLVSDLERDGYSAYIAPLTRSGKTLHRVRVGPEPVRADADRLASRLKARGLPASVVAAD